MLTERDLNTIERALEVFRDSQVTTRRKLEVNNTLCKLMHVRPDPKGEPGVFVLQFVPHGRRRRLALPTRGGLQGKKVDPAA